MNTILTVSILVVAGVLGTRAEYGYELNNMKVYKVFIENSEQLAEYKKLSDNLELHYLNEIGGVGKYYDVAVKLENQADFESRLNYYNIKSEVVIQNLKKYVYYY